MQTNEPAPILLVNKAKCLRCFEVLHSKHRYDYQRCSCGNLSIDGGLDYMKVSYEEADMIDVSLAVFTTDEHAKIRDNFTWGTYGKDGKSPLKYKLLKELTDEHIAVILRTQVHIKDYVRKIFEDEQQYRFERSIVVTD